MTNIISLHGERCAVDNPASRSIPELVVEHKMAWEAFQVASEGEASVDAEDAMHEALFALCCTPVQSEADVMALHWHLSWYVDEEREHAAEIAQALLAAIKQSAQVQLDTHFYEEPR